MLVRELVKAGAEVKVIMTDAAREFITPLTLSTLSKNPVLYRFTDDEESGEWNNHVELGLWADALIIAPCSANTMGKMAQGICDNLLMATYLSARCQTFIAPAMDLDMYTHGSTQSNLQIIAERGDVIIYPQEGELASGLVGRGRMTEPEDIKTFLSAHFYKGIDLSGKKVMITAGPTYEDLDPVRFLGNRSSGKMGFALAEAAAYAGAEVTLICGPNHLTTDHSSICRIDVRSAAEMYDSCQAHGVKADVVIMAAAVADYRPRVISDSKIKKSDDDMSIALERTIDILAELGKNKRKGQIHVGFALESDNGLANAQSKLIRKNLDFIVLNSLRDPGAGFAHDTNRITILGKDNKRQEFELKSKDLVALDILASITEITDE
ncbi:UNVERIFIED_CONTAM: hypothetical protein GTU68_013578 [Idotea baltica]|nr:hypothetical protein [Idotea baltica]